MNNMISFMRLNGNTTFKDHPFCEVDSTILSQLVYLNYDIIMQKFDKTEEPLTFLKLNQSNKKETLFNHIRDAESNRELFAAVVNSLRYQNVLLNYYVNEVDSESEKQFSAISYFLGDFIYIAYRGTDASFIGWKEDFNMAFLSPIPSQLAGSVYLTMISEITDKKFILGGHSKGGNIAVFAAIICDESIRKRIIKIYNHDSPGFRNEVFELPSYPKIKDKIDKTVPQSSYFGMLLQHHEDYRVVKSNRFGIMQHDPFSWEINDWHFVCLDKLSGSSHYMNRMLNRWLNAIDDHTRRVFIDTLYSVLAATQANSIDDLKTNWRESAVTIFKSTKAIDKETK